MGRLMKHVVWVGCLIALYGCGFGGTAKESALPMLNTTGGPWPVESYEGDSVQFEQVSLNENHTVEKKTSTVYISAKSQFVFRDGTPIKTVQGDSLFWNDAGHVITRELKRIPENTVFTLHDKPLPVGTALRPRMGHVAEGGGEKPAAELLFNPLDSPVRRVN